MYLISVYFDDKTNRFINRYINVIAEKTGNTFMTENNVPPHITISSIEARNENILIPEFEKLRGKLSSGEIKLVSVGQLFPYVIYITPVLNQYLLNFQNVIFDAVKNIPETTVSKLYQPYSWLPHVTLGKKLDKNQMLTAFEIMRDQFAPFDARVTEIGLAKVNPHKDIIRYNL